MADCQRALDLRLGEHVRAQFQAIGRRPRAGDVIRVYRDDVRPWLEDEALCPNRKAATCPDCAHLAERSRQHDDNARHDEALGRFVRSELFLANDPTLDRTVVAVGAAQVRDWL